MNHPSAHPGPAIDRVRAYHQATKHRLQAYAPGPGFLDWDNQPDPFRVWRGAPRIALPLVDGVGRRSYEDLYRPNAEADDLTEESLGLFLELALGLSAWKTLGPDRWALRNNPSSGNLHPTEGYLLLWRTVSPQLSPGLYHYAPYDHVLERRAGLAMSQAQALCREHPASFGALAFSSIIWREAWKYGARAYRYCQLDVGHALAAARYAAGVLGWNLTVDPSPGDRCLAGLLGLDRQDDFNDAEVEHPELIAVLGHAESTSPDWASVSTAWLDWRGEASGISDEYVEWPQITQVLTAMDKPDLPTSTHWQAPTKHGHWSVDRDTGDAVRLIRTRRSAQRMNLGIGITDEAFYRALARTLPTAHMPPADAYPYTPAINLVLFVHDVTGLAPGLYALIRNIDRFEAFRHAMTAANLAWSCVEQSGLPLYCLRADVDLRRDASRTSCHQGIAGRGAFAVAMIADSARTMTVEGAWAWRRLHWEAGMIGQTLYLEAGANALSGTGIGCFFDDEVHQLLGLDRDDKEDWQVVYHFTVGAALEDARLGTEPPYAHLTASRFKE